MWRMKQKATHSMTQKLRQEPISRIIVERLDEILKNSFMLDKNDQPNRTKIGLKRKAWGNSMEYREEAISSQSRRNI